MDKIKSLIKSLKAFDVVVIGFSLFLITLHIIFNQRIENSLNWIFINLLVISIAFAISYLEAITQKKFWRIVHYWYIAPLILLTFKQLFYMVKPIRVHDYDSWFIAADRWMFGTDPTHLLYQISFPLLTEILQIVYGMFYLLPIILGLSLLKKDRFVALDFALFSVIYGFFLSYLGYFALPGIGPRFTLHDFNSINEVLPGLYVTNYLREMTNTGEGIPFGTPNPAEVVQRDVFPSGHTMITLIVMYLSVKLKSRSRYFFIPVGTLLIFATVYLWYHYVIDLIGGLVFAVISMWSGKIFFNWWRRIIGEDNFEYEKH
ncbi:MAG: phosphatase PAP2 family protein [Ignavibacteriaceae bacterium]|jgi:membrane-associated phospholipid phosphatase|nr:phosphatase PAP2 family protein [Ignavibacteriaceae bacterium]